MQLGDVAAIVDRGRIIDRFAAGGGEQCDIGESGVDIVDQKVGLALLLPKGGKAVQMIMRIGPPQLVGRDIAGQGADEGHRKAPLNRDRIEDLDHGAASIQTKLQQPARGCGRRGHPCS